MKENTKLLRTFIGIDLDPRSREQATTIIQHLKMLPQGKMITWEHSEKLHITLRFIGATKPSKLQEIISQVSIRVQSFHAFRIHLGPVEAFPNEDHPHVVSLTLSPKAPLIALANAVDQGVIASNFPPENRVFHPHLTLGRLRVKHWPFSELIFKDEENELAVAEVILFESAPDKGTTRYLPLTRFKLLPFSKS